MLPPPSNSAAWSPQFNDISNLVQPHDDREPHFESTFAAISGGQSDFDAYALTVKGAMPLPDVNRCEFHALCGFECTQLVYVLSR